MKDDHNNHRVKEWEAGLPSAADLPALDHLLITRALAKAFCIPTDTRPPTAADVLQASKSTLQQLRHKAKTPLTFPTFETYRCYESRTGTGRGGGGGAEESADEGRYQRGKGAWRDDEEKAAEPDMYYWPGQGGAMAGDHGGGLLEAGSESTRGTSLDKSRTTESDDVDSADGNTARALKRPRLVWTPQLHKRFVDAVGHLGIKNAVPKTIMQLMNVEGLTRENVASHLQKYRLYLKRMQGLASDGPSASDPLFASAPLPNLTPSPHFFPHARPDHGGPFPAHLAHLVVDKRSPSMWGCTIGERRCPQGSSYRGRADRKDGAQW